MVLTNSQNNVLGPSSTTAGGLWHPKGWVFRRSFLSLRVRLEQQAVAQCSREPRLGRHDLFGNVDAGTWMRRPAGDCSNGFNASGRHWFCLRVPHEILSSFGEMSLFGQRVL